MGTLAISPRLTEVIEAFEPSYVHIRPSHFNRARYVVSFKHTKSWTTRRSAESLRRLIEEYCDIHCWISSWVRYRNPPMDGRAVYVRIFIL
jgi:hypothetical protein